MQWDSSTYAGFSTQSPWISVHDDFRDLNAALQIADKQSVYHFWSTILRLRKELPALLVYGSFELFSSENPDIFGYTRVSDMREIAVVIINFRSRLVTWTPPRHLGRLGPGEIVLTNYPGRRTIRHFSESLLNLEPLEAFVWLGEMGTSRL